MNNDLISREALKEEIRNNKKVAGRFIEGVIMLIDNAPTVDITEEQAIDKLHKTGWLPMHDKEMTERPQGEITNDDIQQAIKEGFANGYEMAKEKIIHSIAKQYSEHNELVPIWLSIGDIKDGAV